MKLAIIGPGLLGLSVAEAALAASVDYVLVEHGDFDVTDDRSIERMLRQHRPDVVLNTAALHRLDACEADPNRAFEVNARGAERIARRVPTVFSSTDYVFWDGGPHDESLPGGQPRSVYGRSKLAGELATLEHGGIVVRISSVYGHYESRAKGNKGFPDMFLKSHDSIKLPTDQVFSPTYAPDAAERIFKLAWALHEGKADGVYHAANKGSTTWAEFAEHINALTQHNRHVIPYAAKDPLRSPNSALKSTRLPQLRHWALGLSAWAQREGRQLIVSPRRTDDA